MHLSCFSRFLPKYFVCLDFIFLSLHLFHSFNCEERYAHTHAYKPLHNPVSVSYLSLFIAHQSTFFQTLLFLIYKLKETQNWLHRTIRCNSATNNNNNNNKRKMAAFVSRKSVSYKKKIWFERGKDQEKNKEQGFRLVVQVLFYASLSQK